MTTSRLGELLRTLAEIVAAGAQTCSGDLSTAAETLARIDRANPSGEADPAIVELLDGPFAGNDGTAAAALVRSASAELGWYTSYADHDEADIVALRERYAVACLAGPYTDRPAVIESDEVSIWLTLQGPGTFYPSHVHKAVEYYCVLAGTGDWQAGDSPFETRTPGSWITHPTGTRHAMRTGESAMLSLAIWTTDLASIPVIVRA